MTRAAPRQQRRPQHRRAQQRQFNEAAFHVLPFLVALAWPSLLAAMFS